MKKLENNAINIIPGAAELLVTNEDIDNKFETFIESSEIFLTQLETP